MSGKNFESPFRSRSSAPMDPELQKMLANMAEGKSPSGSVFSGRELDRLVRDSEKRQLQEMKRSGIHDPEDLPGENN